MNDNVDDIKAINLEHIARWGLAVPVPALAYQAHFNVLEIHQEMPKVARHRVPQVFIWIE